MEILFIEDNPSDIRLTLEAFKELKLTHKINIVKNGVEALNFLNKEGKYKETSEPALILLDLDLPQKSGYEVLKEIKTNPELKHIPVIILSITDNKSIDLYNMGVNSYLSKPLNFDEFIDMIKLIDEFWLNTVMLPEIY